MITTQKLMLKKAKIISNKSRLWLIRHVNNKKDVKDTEKEFKQLTWRFKLARADEQTTL